MKTQTRNTARTAAKKQWRSANTMQHTTHPVLVRDKTGREKAVALCEGGWWFCASSGNRIKFCVDSWHPLP